MRDGSQVHEWQQARKLPNVRLVRGSEEQSQAGFIRCCAEVAVAKQPIAISGRVWCQQPR